MNRYAIASSFWVSAARGNGGRHRLRGQCPDPGGRSGLHPEQYAALRLLLDHLMNRYAIPRENILTHAQYAPGRKWDPGVLFDRERLGL